MSGVNKVILIGNLGSDPEVRMTGRGEPVANLSVATSESWNDRDGTRQERTEWHRVVLFGRLAELAQRFLAKGRKVYVEGRLQTRTWDDAQSGQRRSTVEVVARELVFLDSGAGREGAARPAPAPPAQGGYGPAPAEAGPPRGYGSPAGGYPGPPPDCSQRGGYGPPPADDDPPF